MQGKGDSLNFDAVDWYELLREGDRMEGLNNGHWQVMSEDDPEHSVKLVVDEWGPWYKPGGKATQEINWSKCRLCGTQFSAA